MAARKILDTNDGFFTVIFQLIITFVRGAWEATGNLIKSVSVCVTSNGNQFLDLTRNQFTEVFGTIRTFVTTMVTSNATYIQRSSGIFMNTAGCLGSSIRGYVAAVGIYKSKKKL